MKVVGIDVDGCLICEVKTPGPAGDLPVGSRYNCGMTLEEYGVNRLDDEELAACGLEA